jgi:hypothetical protein
VPHRFADDLKAIQSPHRRQNMRGVGPLAATRLDQLALATPREQRIEEQILRRPSDQPAAKFAEDRGIKPGIGELQAQHVFPVNATPHRVCRLAIGKPFGELEECDERQLPGGLSRLTVPGEQRQKGLISEQRLQLIGQSQVPVSPGKHGAGDTVRFRWDWFDRHRAKHGAPPRVCLKPSPCRGIVPVRPGLRQQYHFW